MVSREVPYSAQTYDSPNPIARFAHRTRYRVSLATASRLLPEGGSMVDFGAGDGTFLHRFGAERPDARLVAIEPYMTIRHPGIAQVADLGEVEPASVDLIGTFEVLEHVTDAELAGFLANARRALKPGGLLLVTVPIMYGAMLPVKELSRMVLYRRLSESSPAEIARATLGRPITRPEDRLPTHKGFDFRWLEGELAGSFAIRETFFSPFPALPWWLNSQAIFVAG